RMLSPHRARGLRARQRRSRGQRRRTGGHRACHLHAHEDSLRLLFREKDVMSEALKSLIAACPARTQPYQALVERVPYVGFLGIRIESRGEELTFVLPKQDSNLGNPTLPALHGGAVAGFMEQAALIFLLLEMGEPRLPKTIDFTIDYLR